MGFRFAERVATRRAPSVTGFAGATFPYREGEARGSVRRAKIVSMTLSSSRST